MGATVLIAEIVLVQVRHGNLGEDLANVCDTRVDPAQLPPSVMKRAVQDGAVATSAAVDRVFVGIGDVVVLQCVTNCTSFRWLVTTFWPKSLS